MTLPTDPPARHREVARGFTAQVEAVTDWDAPSPVAEWTTRDVVRHLVDWFPSFLASGAGVRLPEVPSPTTDPVGSWREHAGHVQALLDDPGSDSLVLRNPNTGEVPLPEAIDRFYTSDVFMHTWDLARGAGLEDHLDLEECARLADAMEPMAEMLASSGHYGPRVRVPDDADAQTRLLGLIGRDPAWTP